MAINGCRDLVETKAEFPIGEYCLESVDLAVGVDPVPGLGAGRRHQQPDLVVVVQRTHRHARHLSEFAHGHDRHPRTVHPHVS